MISIRFKVTSWPPHGILTGKIYVNYRVTNVNSELSG
jgi:hypothetical protein